MIDFIIRNKIKSLLANREEEPVFKSLEEINRVLVLFDVPEKEGAAKFINQLKKLGKQVTACGYVSKHDGEVSLANCIVLHQKEDLNFFKIPSEGFFLRINQVEYDAIIDLTLTKNLTLEYLQLSVKASFRIGLKKEEEAFYDLAISIPLEEMPEEFVLSSEYLGQQILHYLQMINRDRVPNQQQ